MNSVSSVLSANDSLFESGFEKLKQPGFWALKSIQPPNVTSTSGQKKRKTTKMEDEIIDIGGVQDLSNHPVNPAFNPQKLKPLMSLDSTQAMLIAKHYADRLPTVQTLLPAEREATPTTVKAAEEIKRKLVERLLKVDTKILQEALANTAPVPPLAKSPSASPLPITKATEVSSAIRIFASGEGCAPGRVTPSPITSTDASSLNQQPLHIAPLPSTAKKNPIGAEIGSFQPLGSSLEQKRPMKFIKPQNYVRASPHENEILDSCLRVDNPDSILNRLRRKLLMRRAKRRVGLPVFDIDAFMYKYLKGNDPLRLSDGAASMSDEDVDIEVVQPIEPKTFFDVPFHRDPTLSFKSKIIGNTNVIENFPTEIISPFSGVRLPSIIYKDEISRPKKLLVLKQLHERFQGVPGKGNLEDEAVYFLHIRNEFLSQTNRLLRTFFWPSIDMIESLDYPDYGILVMYRKMVIGCAFVTPDGYLTYFLIHPDWANSGLGKKLLYFVIMKGSPQQRDITLHVSISNPALLLYQKFGFKPEEYIVNFYDKYFRSDTPNNEFESYSKNAFFIRYRR